MTDGLLVVRRGTPEARYGDYHWIELEDDENVAAGQRYRSVPTGEELLVERVPGEDERATRRFRPRALFARCQGTVAQVPPLLSGSRLVFIGRDVRGEAA